MKKILLSAISLSWSIMAHAGESVGEVKSTATMQSTCSIETESINFGVVASPLMAQTASSDMTVKCNNSLPYTINLAYGGIYGQGSSNSGFTVSFNSSGQRSNSYYIYDKSGSLAGFIECGYSGSDIGKVRFSNSVIANLYDSTYTSGFQTNNGACTSNNKASGTYPKGWVGAYNATGYQSVGGPGYAYGIMNGMSRGDALAYSINVPGDSSKVWNAGNNYHQATGNGESQTIPMNAKIVPDKSGSKYPAPDMYLDTITAIISY